MTMITPSSELTLTKGTSPAGLNEFALGISLRMCLGARLK